MVDHQWQVVQQANTDSSVGVGEQSNDDWRYLRLILIIGQFLPYLHDCAKDFGTPTAKLYRFEQLWEHFHLEKVGGKIVGHFI